MKKLFLAAAAMMLAGTPAFAQTVTHTDGTLAGWSHETNIRNGPDCGVGVGEETSGGNPDAFLHVYEYTCGYVGYGHLSTFSWNPGTQGAITSLAMKYDTKAIGTAMAFLPLIQQGGQYFVSSYGVSYVGEDWQTKDNQGYTLDGNGDPYGPPPVQGMATSAQWCNIYYTFANDGLYTCGAAVLDFSSSGGLITFGVQTANSDTGYGYVGDGGIDNFEVTLEHDEAETTTPEPASLVLLGSGLSALGVFARRRRRAYAVLRTS